MCSWRSFVDYPNAVSTTSGQWAWEFVRRNPKYRQDWAIYCGRCELIKAKYAGTIEDRAEPTSFAYLKHDPLGTVYEPERNCDETDSAWIVRVGKGVSTPLNVWLGKKWGMRDGLADPDKGYRHFLWADAHSTVCLVHITSRDETKPAIQFDLSRPLKPQFTVAARFLEDHKKRLVSQNLIAGASRNVRRRPGLEYRRHLQLLDALIELGQMDVAKPKTKVIREIGATLFPGAKNPNPQYPIDAKVRAMIPIARALRDAGYAQLPGLPEEIKQARNRKK